MGGKSSRRLAQLLVFSHAHGQHTRVSKATLTSSRAPLLHDEKPTTVNLAHVKSKPPPPPQKKEASKCKKNTQATSSHRPGCCACRVLTSLRAKAAIVHPDTGVVVTHLRVGEATSGWASILDQVIDVRLHGPVDVMQRWLPAHVSQPVCFMFFELFLHMDQLLCICLES